MSGSSPLRFAMITTFYPPYSFGGDAVGVQRLSAALVRRGHQVTVIHDVGAYELLHRGPAPDPYEEQDGIRVHRLKGFVYEQVRISEFVDGVLEVSIQRVGRTLIRYRGRFAAQPHTGFSRFNGIRPGSPLSRLACRRFHEETHRTKIQTQPGI